MSVYVLYDELGSSGLKPDWLADFSTAGIEVLPFNTRQGPHNRFQLNFRNHRKIVVVEGKSAWVGGLNVGDDYLGEDPKLSPWRDTHMHIQGPAALAAQLTFMADWYWASHKLLENLSWDPQPADGSDKNVLILSSGPADELETASLFFTTVLNLARKRIWIATPFETITTFGGDCEDIAIAKYLVLRLMGVPDDQLGFAHVFNSNKEHHMVLIYKASEETEAMVLDNENPDVKPASERPDLIAVYIFRNDGTTFLIKDEGGGERNLTSTLENKRLQKWLTAKERSQKNAESLVPFNNGRPLTPDWLEKAN